MTPRGFLLVLLLIQCALVAWVYWPRVDDAVENAVGPLVHMQPADVDEIHIADDRGNELVLHRAGGRWTLAESDELPVDGEKVARLLTSLSRPRPDWPVGKTAAARQRFQVADYHFQRRIILIGRDQLLGTLYLGTSPGFRKVHARADRQQAVYSIDFNNFDAPAIPEPWLDAGLLQLRVPVSIATETYDIRREGEGWISGWGQAPDQRELLALLDSLENLQVLGVASEDLQRDLAAIEPDLTLHAESLGGAQSLELYSLDGTHYVHSSRFVPFFVLSDYEYQKLASIDAERIMGGEEPAADTAAGPALNSRQR